MLALLPPPDHVKDPQMWITAAVMLFSEYPSETWPAVVHGIPRRTSRPQLCDIRAALDQAYEPIRIALDRKRIVERNRFILPPARAQRTPDEQAQVDAQISRVKLMFGEGLRKERGDRLRIGDGRHFERIRADLEERRARNAAAAAYGAGAHGLGFQPAETGSSPLARTAVENNT